MVTPAFTLVGGKADLRRSREEKNDARVQASPIVVIFQGLPYSPTKLQKNSPIAMWSLPLFDVEARVCVGACYRR
jgi:hypothetical protein